MSDDSLLKLPGFPDPFDRAAFVARFGPVFEHSPWVAEAAWALRPFDDLQAVHRAMVQAVHSSPRAQRLALLRAHPELWGREARERRMTADSAAEQSKAGLFSLTAEQAARITRMNAEHQQKFGFPFIIAAMNHSREQILSEFERRLAMDPEAANEARLAQVAVITGLRIGRLAASAVPGSQEVSG
ncbi:MAG: 2-oxo-4-hydroxy-4-carboxy-5-ureidoimidazoline decarboxylase [bacterium]